MNIDINTINSESMRIINDILEDIYEVPDNENRKEYLLMTIGEIHGVVLLANALKEN